MSDPRRYPFVYFQPYDADDNPVDGLFVAVEFDSPFTWEAGLKPNINQAVCSPLELEKLGDTVAKTGQLLWYYTNDPEADDDGSGADLTIPFVAIIDVRPHQLGQSPQLTDGVTPIAWEVYFSDWRDGFTFPRGGRLRIGIVNQTPNPNSSANANPDPSDDDADPDDDLYQNSDLIRMCFDAMGITEWATVPDGVDDVQPVTNLQWHGAHAPTELAQLLAQVGATICPKLDATAAVEIYGQGDEPQIDAEDLIADLNLPIIDRRGKIVIFSSAPTPMIQTGTITGPSTDTWQMVIQNSKGQWIDIANLTDWGAAMNDMGIAADTKPIDLLNKNFTQIIASKASGDAMKVKNRFSDQLYRCIRLNPDNYPPDRCPILSYTIEADGSVGTPAAAALIAVNNAAGVFVTADDPVDVPILKIEAGNILHLRDRLVQANDGSDSGNKGIFMELATSDSDSNDTEDQQDDPDQAELSVRLSQEMTEPGTDDKGNDIFLPQYYEVGYQLDANGDPQKLADDDLQNELAAPDRDTIIQWRPEWTDLLVAQVDGELQDYSTIDSAAEAEAKTLLADLSQPQREIHVRGFFACELSGRVNKVQWNQKDCTTLISVGQFFRPGSHHLKTVIGDQQ